jgi:type I restriction enzyme S subunit
MKVPIRSFAKRLDIIDRPDLELLSVYREHGVIPKSSRDDNHNKPSEDLSTYRYVRPGNLVLNKMKTWQGSLAVSEYEGIVSPAYFVCELSDTVVHPRYIHHLLRSEPLIAEYGARSKGIRPNQWDLPYDDFKSIEVELPKVEEQRRIADFLDDQVARIDEAISLRKVHSLAAREEFEAQVLNALTGGLDPHVGMKASSIPWAPRIPETWDQFPARALVDVGTGFGDTIDAEPDGEFPFYVRSDTPQQSRTYTFDCEAVLTSGDGAGVGKIFHLVHGKFHAHQRVYVLTNFRRVSAQFFYYYFSTFFREAALDGSAKSTVDSVRRDMITSLPVAVPPEGKQAEICNYLGQAQGHRDDIHALGEASIELLEERKRALITAAVTGQIDVTTAKSIGIGEWVPNVDAKIDTNVNNASPAAASIGGI